MNAAVRKSETPVASPSPKPAAPQLDKFGRDPASPGEQLRRQTNYANDSGYAPLYAAWLADIPRLSSGLVCSHFLMTVAVLSLGRPDNVKGNRNQWTKAVTVEYLAGVIRCHVRDVQRQIKDLSERKIIAVKCSGRGTYSISLLYRDWQSLPDYQSGAKLVAIDEPEEDGSQVDSETVEQAKDAVRLVKRPLQVRPGKTGRAIAVTTGVKRLRWQNAATLPLVYDAVVQAGELVISTRMPEDWRTILEREEKANARRHGCRDEVADGAAAVNHPRAAELVEVFDPLLEKSGSRLLIGDSDALLKACRELGEMPRDFLVDWLHAGDKARAARPISGPKVVASIVREARENWKRGNGRRPATTSRPASAARKSGSSSFRDSVRREAARRLDKRGRI